MITFVAVALCGLHVVAWLVSPSSPREEVLRNQMPEGSLETSMA